MKKILIIEDDATMLRGLKDNFEFEGYQVLVATDGERGLQMALETAPDLIVLDLMLPRVNGYEICRFIREEKLDVPILMLTARDGESDVVLGLKLGADDYVTKPFSIKELMARVEALLRRRSAPGAGEPSEGFRFGDFLLDPASHRLLRDGQEIKLSPKEYLLLQLLAGSGGKALSREVIMREVWGYGSYVTPRSIDRFVTVLRKKIEPDPHHPVYIETVREYGYRFSAESCRCSQSDRQ